MDPSINRRSVASPASNTCVIMILRAGKININRGQGRHDSDRGHLVVRPVETVLFLRHPPILPRMEDLEMLTQHVSSWCMATWSFEAPSGHYYWSLSTVEISIIPLH